MTEPVKTRQLGRYQLDRLISRGGMGEIYLAHAEGAAGFRKSVCIKRILPHLAREQEFVDRFIDEANIVVHLTHGNIVPVFDMGEADGEYFIAMEYLPGRDLRDIIKRYETLGECMPIPAAVWVIGEICKALSYAHKKTDVSGEPLHIIHRDVSPSNVLVSREGVVKLTDFGIAKAVGKLGKSITGRLQGKFSYMSPEQASGLSVDPRSDIFSAASLAYELLTGVRPFETDSDLGTLDAVRRAEVVPPSTHRAELPAGVDAALLQALSRDPAERPADATELGVALREATSALGVAVESDMAAELRRLFPGQESGPPAPRGMGLDDILAEEAERMLAGSPSGESHTITASSSKPPTLSLGVRQGELSPTPSPSRAQLTPAETPTPASATAPQRGEPRTLSLWLSGVAVALVAGLGAMLLWVQPGWLVETRVVVTCEPDGAEVLVENERRGICDLTLGDVRPGLRRIEVVRDGFLPQERTVDVRRGEETRVVFALQADPQLDVRVWVPQSGGRFRIGDSQDWHNSGDLVPLNAGQYEVTATASGYVAVTRRVSFGPGQASAEISVAPPAGTGERTGGTSAAGEALAPGEEAGTGDDAGSDGGEVAHTGPDRQMVSLSLLGLPPGAVVRVDGHPQPAGRPIRLSRSDDPVTISVEAEGFEPVAPFTFDPRTEGSSSRDVTMRPRSSETRLVRFHVSQPGTGTVYLDGELLGSTEGVYELPVGCYEASVVNVDPEFGRREERTVCVVARQADDPTDPETQAFPFFTPR